MQQRRPRLGDILDDYCPRERRITNHVVVAMIEDDVRQTRCATCDADHEYKHAKVPPQRRKRTLPSAVPPPAPRDYIETETIADADMPVPEPAETFDPAPPDAAADPEAEEPSVAAADEDGPVHRRLIRATLPRPEGQPPERREPDFTIRQPNFRGRPFDQNNGQRQGRSQTRGPGGSSFGFSRQGQGQGGPRHGSGQGGPRHGSGQAPRHGSGQGSGPGFRPGGNRPGHSAGPRGPRHGAGRGGRKR